MIKFRIQMPEIGPRQNFGRVSAAVDEAGQLVLRAIQRRLIPHVSRGEGGSVKSSRSLTRSSVNFASGIRASSTRKHMIETWRTEKLDDHSVRVFSDDPVAEYLDKGTKPHPIDPLGSNRALRFEGTGNVFRSGPLRGTKHTGIVEGEIFTPRVNHPGQRGIHYVAAAQNETNARIQAMIAKAAEEEIELEIEHMFTGSSRFSISPRTGRRFYSVRGAGGRFA